jgi:DNA-binding GntR family transcriptional regulator
MSGREHAATALERRPRLDRKSAGGVVADYVRELIFNGELESGDRVPQQQIAEALGVSRIPVREGVVALEREGVVTVEPHRGAFVNRLDGDTIEDHFELFGLIYGFAARRTAERASPEEVEELGQLQESIEGARQSEKMLAAVARFRNELVRVGGSPRLNGLMLSLAAIVPGNFFKEIPGSMPIAREGFRKTLDAIKAGDGERAGACCVETMRSHATHVAATHKKRRAARK